MYFDNEVKQVYNEETNGKRYHNSIVSKPKERVEDTPGEVHTLYLNKPMLWAEFKTLTKDLKRMYIEHLCTTFCPTQKEVYTMLGCSPAHFHRTLEYLGLIGVFPGRKSKQTKAQKKAWKDFLNNEGDTKSKQAKEPKTIESNTVRSTTIKEFTFTQSGPFNFDEFIKRLSAFIKDGDDCTLTVSTHNNTHNKEAINLVPHHKEL